MFGKFFQKFEKLTKWLRLFALYFESRYHINLYKICFFSVKQCGSMLWIIKNLMILKGKKMLFSKEKKLVIKTGIRDLAI